MHLFLLSCALCCIKKKKKHNVISQLVIVSYSYSFKYNQVCALVCISSYTNKFMAMRTHNYM